MTIRKHPALLFNLALTGLLLLSHLAFTQLIYFIHVEDLIDVSTGLRLIDRAGRPALAAFAILTAASWLGLGRLIVRALEKWLAGPARPVLGWSLFGLALIAYLYLVLGPYGIYLGLRWPRLWIFAWSVLAGLAGLALAGRVRGWRALSAAMLSFGALHFIAFFLPQVSSYPFSLAWSETSRYYHASLYLDQRVYGLDLPWPHRDFTRYWVQAAPFLIKNSPLWLHRLWQAALRALGPFITAWALARRFSKKGGGQHWVFICWAGLFIAQGPVFYPMLVIVAAMLFGFNSHRLGRSTLLILAASVWAGLTRLNWIPMPAMLAITIYLLETRLADRSLKGLGRYIAFPAVWGLVGSALGLAAQRWYEANSGLNPEIFSSSFTSDLLWYRLWPNVSYPLGILPAVLLASGPLLLYTIFRQRGHWGHWMRWLALAGMLVLLFAGGLVVSVKIGGGTNLHNMDAYLVLLLVIGAYVYFGEYAAGGRQKATGTGLQLILAAAVVIPVFFAIIIGAPFQSYDFDSTLQIIDDLQIYLDDHIEPGDKVLFLTQRHLLTFGYIEGVDLVHDYEKLVLMEIAMSDNQFYLDQFQQELQAREFRLIVTDKISRFDKTPGVDALAEENNVFNAQVLAPLLCYYESDLWLREVGIEVWEPLAESACE